MVWFWFGKRASKPIAAESIDRTRDSERVRIYQLGTGLAIHSSFVFFRAADLGESLSYVPVTNLKGLVSRSPSDIFAIVLLDAEKGRESGGGGVNWGQSLFCVEITEG